MYVPLTCYNKGSQWRKQRDGIKHLWRGFIMVVISCQETKYQPNTDILRICHENRACQNL